MNNLLSYLHTKLQHTNRINESSFTQLLDKKKAAAFTSLLFFRRGNFACFCRQIFRTLYKKMSTSTCEYLGSTKILHKSSSYLVRLSIEGLVKPWALHGCSHKGGLRRIKALIRLIYKVESIRCCNYRLEV